MATANNSISLAALDFDTLKNNLKTFLSSQSAFKDYDYAGSNMNVLLDVLTYNSYLNAFYLNMAISESFLDSAQLRSSVSSHAKDLNYTPRSNRSSVAVINLTIPTSNAVTLFIPKGTSFTGKNISGNYTFTTDKSLTLTSGTNVFSANLSIYEGSYSQDSFLVDYTNETQRFSLINPSIDTTSLTVIVSENDGLDVSEFMLAENLYGLNANSNVYFLQTDVDGRYQILFGDNVLGRKPLNGSVVTAEYRSCAGSIANGVDTFAIEVDLSSINNTRVLNGVTTTTITASTNGANVESIESIRYNAPRHYQTQERAITTQDYIDLISANFPNIESVSAYGGETVTGTSQVEYGKVYVSCSTYSGSTLSNSQKQDVATFLQPRVALGITPVLVDPDYTYLVLNTNVHVDFNQTGLTPEQLKTLVVNTISTFNDNYLMIFGADFRLSVLMSTIDLADISIISNETSALMYKNFVGFQASAPTALTADFHGNALKPGTILSNQFSSGGKNYVFTDYIPNITNSTNTLYKLEKSTNTTALNYSSAGNIDYTNGLVNIGITSYDSTPAGGLRIFASPVNQDIYTQKNNIIEIDTAAGVFVTIVNG
jgi:hypothetical protein